MLALPYNELQSIADFTNFAKAHSCCMFLQFPLYFFSLVAVIT